MKRPGQCDFGKCPKDAIMVLVIASEERPMCGDHAAFTIEMLTGARKAGLPLPRVTLQICNEPPKKG